MNTMAPTRPAELRACRVQLSTGPAAAAGARSLVRAAGMNAVAANPRNLRLPRGRPAPSPYTCTHHPVTRVRLPGSESPRAAGAARHRPRPRYRGASL